jgi:hypothetical protein
MHRTTGDVDHRQAGSGTKIRAEQAACLVAVELQTTGVGAVFAGRDDAAESAAAADGDHLARARREFAHPVDHRPAAAGKDLKAAAAVRPAQQRAFDAEDVEGQCATGRRVQEIERILAAGFRQGGMEKQVDTGIGKLRQHAGAVLGAEQRLCAAAATRGLQPEHFHPRSSP